MIHAADVYEAIDILRGLGNGTRIPFDIEEGICQEVKRFCNPGLVGFIKQATETWTKFSLDPLFPVPDPTGTKSPKNVFLESKDVWEGRYGAYRKELALYIAEWLEENLDYVLMKGHK